MKGIVYCIKEKASDEILYIGSTTQTLNNRICAHMWNCYSFNERLSDIPIYVYIRSKAAMKKDFENIFKVDVLINSEFDSKQALRVCEQSFIEKIKPLYNCVKAYLSYEGKIQNNKAWRDRNRDKWNEYSKNNRDSEYHKKYAEANKEKIKARSRDYYEANKEKIKARSRDYYEDNKQKHSDLMKEYYDEHREEILAKSKERYAANRDEILARRKAKRAAKK